MARITYDSNDSQYDVCECPNCDNVVLAVGQDDPPLSCHGDEMDRVVDVDVAIEPPDLRGVLLQAFGLPKAELDICLCVIGQGPLSASEVGEELEYDRSTVTRYLDKLVRTGLLQRSELNREDGGIVNVHHSIDLGRMRRETLVGFYVRAGEAASLIEAANRTKEKILEANTDAELQAVFWDAVDEE